MSEKSALNWRLAIQVFMPSWKAFILGTSLLGSEDTLGVPEIKEGRWVDVTCETVEVDINQGFVQPHPLSSYDTGTATITMRGVRYAPSLNPDFLPGVEMRVVAYRPPIDPPFTQDYDLDFLVGGGSGVMLPIFYGYVIDAFEDHGKDADTDTISSLVIECVDEYYKVVKLGGSYARYDFPYQSIPDVMRSWNIRVADYALPDNPTITVFRNNLRSVERAAHSAHGAVYVRGNAVLFRGRDVWDFGTPVVEISDNHVGEHLCYYDFDKVLRLTNIVNVIEQNNVTYDAANNNNDVTTTTTHRDDFSELAYGPSGQSVETSTPNWVADEYFMAGRFPQVRTTAVTVQVTQQNLDVLPQVMDTVAFTYNGNTEIRMVSNKHIRLAPTGWEADLQFFDWTLGEAPTAGDFVRSTGRKITRPRIPHTPREWIHTDKLITEEV